MVCVAVSCSVSAHHVCYRRFPKARVWPPLPATAGTPTKGEDDWAACLPPLDVQEHLLELYFTYVHTQLPILHKASFMEIFRTGSVRLRTSCAAGSKSVCPHVEVCTKGWAGILVRRIRDGRSVGLLVAWTVPVDCGLWRRRCRIILFVDIQVSVDRTF